MRRFIRVCTVCLDQYLGIMTLLNKKTVDRDLKHQLGQIKQGVFFRHEAQCVFSRHEAGDQYSLFVRPFITISLYSLDKFIGVCLPII